jgi:hypothetical protein
MPATTPIYYTDYCDFPRVFVATHGNVSFLFDAGFDEATDEYPDEFEVFLLPALDLRDAEEMWGSLRSKVVRRLGTIPTSAVRFTDGNRKWEVDVAILERLAGS